MHLVDGSASSSAPKKQKRLSSFEPPQLERQPAAKKLKKSNQERRPPASFWDNLSRQFLTRRALREFDRRTTRCRAPLHTSWIDPVELPSSRLKRFARRGGPDLETLRSYPEPKSAADSSPMSSNPSSSRKSKSQRTGPSSNTSFTKWSGRRTSAYDPNFKQHLDDYRIFSSTAGNRADKPANEKELLHQLNNPRPSLSPSRFTTTDFEAFQLRNDEATSEASVMSRVFPIIVGDKDIPSQQNVDFNNLAPLTIGSPVNAKPDFYDGTLPSEGNRLLREALDEFIVPSTNTSRPCLPNFFAEGKGPKGNGPVAKLQACYDGAIGARGMHEVRSYANNEPAFDNNAYTITSTYTGGTAGGFLTLYATHPTSSDDPRHPVEYRMTQLGSYSMTHNLSTFREGASAIRNAREWAREQREQAIQDANARAVLLASETATSQASQSSNTTQGASDTSVDELAGDGVLVTSFASSTSFSASASQEPQASGTQRRPRKKSDRTLKRRRGANSNE